MGESNPRFLRERQVTWASSRMGRGALVRTRTPKSRIRNPVTVQSESSALESSERIKLSSTGLQPVYRSSNKDKWCGHRESNSDLYVGNVMLYLRAVAALER